MPDLSTPVECTDGWYETGEAKMMADYRSAVRHKVMLAKALSDLLDNLGDWPDEQDPKSPAGRAHERAWIALSAVRAGL